MFGRNVPIKPIYEPRDKLNIISIFRTIQGEGPLAGVAAIFVRLAGCNLKCHFCDTEFTAGAQEKEIPDLAKEIWELIHGYTIGLVVFTGGEPLAQPIVPLLEALTRSGLHVQIETAGTVWQPGLEVLCENARVTIVCSPKTANVHPLIEKYCRHWKYIIRSGEVSAMDGLPVVSTQDPGRECYLFRPDTGKRGKVTPPDHIWVQPCDEYRYHVGHVDATPPIERDVAKNQDNMALCVQIAQERGYRISLQTHKILNVE